MNRVISVCTRKDLDTFATASRYITTYIKANTYRVVVPTAHVSEFRQRCDPAFEVIDEALYNDIRNCLLSYTPPSYPRFGWYFQQFLKLEELRQCEPDTLNLIWDADTLPLRPLSFVDGDTVVYAQWPKKHPPYFALISRLFDFDAEPTFSFISQNFPCKAEWIRDFCEELERRFGLPWYRAIMEKIDFEQKSGFSEYETLGGYIFARHRDQISFKSSEIWERRGTSLTGGLAYLPLYEKKMAKDLDFIAFEVWDRPRYDAAAIERRSSFRKRYISAWPPGNLILLAPLLAHAGRKRLGRFLRRNGLRR